MSIHLILELFMAKPRLMETERKTDGCCSGHLLGKDVVKTANRREATNIINTANI